MEKEKYEAPRMEVVNMQDDVVIACTTAASNSGGCGHLDIDPLS